MIPATRDAATMTNWMLRNFARIRVLAPYAAIELILPGGSLMALALWLYRRHSRRAARAIQFRAGAACAGGIKWPGSRSAEDAVAI